MLSSRLHSLSTVATNASTSLTTTASSQALVRGSKFFVVLSSSASIRAYRLSDGTRVVYTTSFGQTGVCPPDMEEFFANFMHIDDKRGKAHPFLPNIITRERSSRVTRARTPGSSSRRMYCGHSTSTSWAT